MANTKYMIFNLGIVPENAGVALKHRPGNVLCKLPVVLAEERVVVLQGRKAPVLASTQPRIAPSLP